MGAVSSGSLSAATNINACATDGGVQHGDIQPGVSSKTTWRGKPFTGVWKKRVMEERLLPGRRSSPCQGWGTPESEVQGVKVKEFQILQHQSGRGQRGPTSCLMQFSRQVYQPHCTEEESN